MALTGFGIVRAAYGSRIGDPLVHCYDGKQLVLAYVERQALMDYFRIPGGASITVAAWNSVIEGNLDTFKRMIAAKYERGDWKRYRAYGQDYPRLFLTLRDIERSGEKVLADFAELESVR
jgi:hypothetical protein